MIHIKGKAFKMTDIFDKKVAHKVTVTDFYMSPTCVTEKFLIEKMQTLFGTEHELSMLSLISGCPLSIRNATNLPLVNISWYDCVNICNWLSKTDGFEPVYTIVDNNVTPNWNANGYRLPTEAEWEFAAREGGKKVRFGNGQNILCPTEANFNATAIFKQPYSEAGEYRGKTVPVNSFKPNALGLYNMSGNVWEWCWDWWDSEYYQKSPTLNPKGPDNGSFRVYRGGSWGSLPQLCRVAYRNFFHPDYRNFDLGFRLVRNK